MEIAGTVGLEDDTAAVGREIGLTQVVEIAGQPFCGSAVDGDRPQYAEQVHRDHFTVRRHSKGDVGRVLDRDDVFLARRRFAGGISLGKRRGASPGEQAGPADQQRLATADAVHPILARHAAILGLYRVKRGYGNGSRC